MKLRIIIAVLLVLLIAECAYLAVTLPGEYDAAVIRTEQENAEVLRRTNEVEEKQTYLDTLRSPEMAAAEEEAKRLLEEAAALQSQKDQVLTEAEGLNGTLTEKQQEFADIEEQYNYYAEVCDELKKGIEKVKGYIAGD